MRAGYARGGAGRPLATVDSFPHPLRSRTPIRDHRRSASRPSFRRKPESRGANGRLNPTTGSRIIDFRNHGIHEYDNITTRTVWEIIQNNLSTLLTEINTL